MRDFRDAKAMARTLRDALKAKAVETTHSECLELIAKAFGFDNWNILSTKVEAAQAAAPQLEPDTPAEGGLAVPAAESPATKKPLYCSFCGKSQHEVTKLIAGPTVFICGECVGLCNGIIENEEVLDFFATEGARARSAERHEKPAAELVSSVLRAKQHIERWRFALAQVRRELALRDGEALPAGSGTASEAFLHLKDKTQDELVALAQRHEDALERYEAAQRTAISVIGAGA